MNFNFGYPEIKLCKYNKECVNEECKYFHPGEPDGRSPILRLIYEDHQEIIHNQVPGMMLDIFDMRDVGGQN